jgi:hypothetical protein
VLVKFSETAFNVAALFPETRTVFAALLAAPNALVATSYAVLTEFAVADCVVSVLVTVSFSLAEIVKVSVVVFAVRLIPVPAAILKISTFESAINSEPLALMVSNVFALTPEIC